MNNRPDTLFYVNWLRYLTFALLVYSGITTAFAEESVCDLLSETRIWLSPRVPQAGQAIKVMAVSGNSPLTDLFLIDDEGQILPLQTHRRGGPPWSLVAATEALERKNYRIVAQRNGTPVACRSFSVGAQKSENGLQDWGLDTEAFYSAWIEELFGAPSDENMSFPSLEPVLRNRERNFLHNYLGRNEDNNLPLTPDCADLPYTLRAYFAWKVGLPIAFRSCGRGSSKAPPRCGSATVKTEFVRGGNSQSVFRNISRQLADTVHSGSARTALQDEATDMYPIPLRRDTLKPGTVFADPYGHVMVVSEWVEQTDEHPGMLLAVDAQPDNSVARKRFWEGTFLFADSPGAGPGFKAFRPLLRSKSGGWRALSNDDLSNHPGFSPFSLEQEGLSPDDFYATIAQLANPNGLDPKQVYEAMLAALAEQIETRVTSLDNGEAYFRKRGKSTIPMPSGAAIFQTVGPWEDYSTPSRDMRLIIAMNVLNDLPEKIIRHPDLFVMNDKSPEQAKAEIEQLHAERIQEFSIQYTRSDGSPWELSIAEILARKQDYEMAYNPNDCVELRWGAQPGTEEYATCKRHAPADQRAKMAQYRPWFHETRRPAR